MSRPYYPVSQFTRKQFWAQAAMLRLLAGAVLAALLAVALFATDMAQAAQPLIKFDGGIGSQPLAAAGATNDVLGVPPGGRPWVIERLTASVDINGNINVDGRGLLLGGGNNIGRTAGQRVRARLLCTNDAINAIVTSHQTELVLLAPNGDFRFNEPLSPPLGACVNPILLIVNANGSWFAAGIPK